MSYPEGILEGPSHETKCDDGGSHVGTSKPKKTPNCSDAMDLFQQSQEEKPSNKMKGTVLSPGADTNPMFYNSRDTN